MEYTAHHHHAYLRSVPCDLFLGDYSISVGQIDNFEPVNDNTCPSLILDVNFDTRILAPCLYTSSFESCDYARNLLKFLAYWFSCLGLPQPCVKLLAREMACFVLSHAWRHLCPSHQQGHVQRVMSVPHISIAHVSLVLERFYEGAVPMVKRATIESIEALETVRQVGLDGSSCVVCLEDLDVDVQGKIVRMPCNHVFHKGCIVEWLENSNMCPLCRFEMPFMEVEV